MAQNKQANAKPVTAGTDYVPIHRRRWFWPATAVVALILIFGFLASLFAVGMGVRHFNREDGFYGRHNHMMMREGGPGGFSAHLNDNQSRLQGVVTSTNGSSFTIAGGGTTNDVQTDSSTQYPNGNQLKVNDTVVVFGTTSNGKFTASRVVINP
jgi:hypothetical protein